MNGEGGAFSSALQEGRGLAVGWQTAGPERKPWAAWGGSAGHTATVSCQPAGPGPPSAYDASTAVSVGVGVGPVDLPQGDADDTRSPF